ncbi:MAG: hypothetical protein QM708_14070 [Propioniciclava sp.]|uniref:DUF6603 domain-containing protein n=1 Tax=Propioniciclava sp. TaxID=2038686 RepID=UPI0039E3B0AE
MNELSAQLLASAVRYVIARVEELATPEKLAEVIDGNVPADSAGVATDLAAARDHADAATTALDDGNVARGAQQAWLAVQEVHDAAKALGVGDLSTVAQRVVGAAPPGAIIRHLGMLDPAIAPRDTGLTLTWTTRNVSLGVFTIGTLSIGFVFSVNSLGVTVRAAQTRADLGAGAAGLVSLLLQGAGEAAADITLTIDQRGLTASGALGPIALPARLQAQVVELGGLDLTLIPAGDQLRVRLRSRIRTDLAGVLGARINGAGFELTLDAGRILRGESPFLPTPAPVAPTGIGLSLNAGPVSGSGELLQVADGYGGALDLRMGPVGVTAFGLLRTSAGSVSFVAVVSVRFDVPIELGLLFTLNAVGGIVGLGVNVNPSAIAAGLRDGVLDRLMFPADVRRAAPQILDTLSAVFPPKPGGLVVGPMVRLGWGRPASLITLDVALVLAVPDPVVLILGRARAAIPDAQAAIIDLRADVMAQFGRGVILIRAELHSSRMGFFSVYGSIGMLIRFSDGPTAVISAGGFHPTYTRKPPELADLRRIGAELSPPIGLQFRVQGYVALTPNTVQFGGSFEVGYSIGVAAVRGGCSLDAIIQFDPFGFAVDLNAHAHVEAFGITLLGVALALHLEGPSPLVVSGRGSISLPWPLPDPSISIGPLRIGGGDPPPELPPPVHPLREVAAALRATDAWQKVDRQGQRLPVRLRAASGTTGVVIEPWGLLRASQRAFPLRMTLERCGRAAVEPEGCRIDVKGLITVGGVPSEVPTSPVTETFPVGQFMRLTKDEQLAAPEFEDRQGGLVIDPAGAETVAGTLKPFATEASLEYEDFWRDATQRSRPKLRFALPDWLAALILDCGPAGASAARAEDRYRPQQLERVIEVRPVSEVRVTDIDTGAEIDGFALWSDARHSARGQRGGLASMTRVAQP